MVLTTTDILAVLAHNVEDVLRVMASADITFAGSSTDGAFAPSSGVLAVLGLSGSYSGAGMLWCEQHVACKLAGRMLMCEFSELSDEVLDAFGELANMIVGNTKNEIEETLGPLGLGTPTVICGSNYRARKAQARDFACVTFEFEGDSIVAAIGLTQSV